MEKANLLNHASEVISKARFLFVYEAESVLHSFGLMYRIEKYNTSNVDILRKTEGVYLLVEEDEVVYVGQSGNVAQRIMNHVDEHSKYGNLPFASGSRCGKRFDSVFVAIVGDQDRNAVEKVLTERLWPRYNGSKWTVNPCLPSPDYSKYGPIKRRPRRQTLGQWH